MNAHPSILYTEDSEYFHKEMKKAMGICLDAKVTGFYDNNDAAKQFDEGVRHDIYILDDNTSDGREGSGFGTRLAVHIAETLQKEGRSGIVIAACASNLAVLGLDSGSVYFSSRERPLHVDDLHRNGVEFWFKHSERHKMLGWLATCIWERKVISRAEWLESVGEDSRYQVEGDNAVEDALLDYVDGLDESDRGSLLHVDFRNLFERLRDGADVRESLEACRLPDARLGGKEE